MQRKHTLCDSNADPQKSAAATSPFGIALQKTHRKLERVDLALPEGLLIGLGHAATNPDSPLDFHQT